MRIANVSHVKHLKKANSLRQAYISVGIIDDPAPEAPTFAQNYMRLANSQYVVNLKLCII